MRNIRWVNPKEQDKLLHIETPLGIVNIRVGLHDAQGHQVESIEIIPNNYHGEPEVTLDGHRNNRLIEGEVKV